MAGERVKGLKLTTGKKGTTARPARQMPKPKGNRPLTPRQSLLQDVIKAERQAAAKIGRLRRNKGVDLTGSHVDPIRRDKPVNRYTYKQLAAYQKQLDDFRDKKTQYYADAHGKPISKVRWDNYKQAEARANAEKQKAYARVKDVVLDIHQPGQGLTVDELRAMTETIFTHDKPTNDPYRVIDRKPHQVANEKALRKLEKEQRRIGTPAYERKRLKQARDTIKKMAADLNAHNIGEKIDSLSHAELELLWNGTSFASRLAYRYHDAKADRRLDSTESTDVDIAEDIVDWVIRRRNTKPTIKKGNTRRRK